MANQTLPEVHNPIFYAALDDVLTTGQAAQRFGYHPRTIAHWAEEGRIAARKDYRGHWMISAQSLSLFLSKSGRKAS